MEWKAAEATALPLGGRPPRNQLVIASGGRLEALIRGGGGGGESSAEKETLVFTWIYRGAIQDPR